MLLGEPKMAVLSLQSFPIFSILLPIKDKELHLDCLMRFHLNESLDLYMCMSAITSNKLPAAVSLLLSLKTRVSEFLHKDYSTSDY